MILNQDFREFIVLLNKNRVRYLVIGGYAVALHGHPRYTKDLDLWVWMDKKNAENILKSLNEFGFGSVDLVAEDFLTPGKVVQLGYPPNRIDLITAPKGVEFEDCYQSKIIVEIDGININLISLNDLKKNKKAAGRHQDLADLDNLK